MTTTALRAGWLFDGVAAALVPNPTVVMHKDVIVSVEADGPPPEGATVVDLLGATIMPGLIDSHVHLAFDASDDPVGTLARRDDAAALAAMAVAARTAVRAGVTTVRDLGDRGYLSLILRANAAADRSLPTIVAAGPPITTPGGHCHYLGGEIDDRGVRGAVREHAERGVDVIKIMASGGNLTPGSRPENAQFSAAELRAAVEEAHRHGLPVAAHAHGTQAIVDALAAGVDNLEHVTFMTAEGVDTIPDDLLASIGARPVTLGITLGVKPISGFAPPSPMASRLPALVANMRRLHGAGASMVPGTDAGVGPLKPHDVLGWAIPQFVRIGMSPVGALRAATCRAAALCGLGDRKGRVAAGFDADLLVLDGNPLEDLSAVHRIRSVYVRGSAVSTA
jgi:imidazolonepropionase-like amidohydrolase